MWSTTARVKSAFVVISPATTARSVVTRVSQATRLSGSCWRQKSRTASLIWSATLSGWPIETDSLVNKYRSVLTEKVLGQWVKGGNPVPTKGRGRLYVSRCESDNRNLHAPHTHCMQPSPPLVA